jgi:hypothetical protein
MSGLSGIFLVDLKMPLIISRPYTIGPSHFICSFSSQSERHFSQSCNTVHHFLAFLIFPLPFYKYLTSFCPSVPSPLKWYVKHVHLCSHYI